MKYPIPPQLSKAVRHSIPPVRILTEYASHIVAYGSVGSGKSHRLRKVMEHLYEEGCKVIDIYDEGRLENCYVALPNPKNKEEGVGYPTECYVPATSNLPSSVPAIFKPFRIAFTDLDFREVCILLGLLNDVQRSILEMAFDNLNRNSTYLDLIAGVQDLLKEKKMRFNDKVLELCDDRSAVALLQKLDKLNRGNIICDRHDPLRLDLDKIMKNKKVITCFSFAWVENPNIRHLIWGYLFRAFYVMRMDRVKEKNTQYPMLVLVHREIQNNAPARGRKSSFSFEGQTISLEFIRKIVQEPRDIKIRILADSQDAMKVESDVRKGFTTKYIFQMDYAVLKGLTQQFYLDPKTIINIQNLDTGVFAVKTKPQPNHPYNRYGIHCPNWSYPTKSWCKSPDDLFFRNWREAGLPFVKVKFITPPSIMKVERIVPEVEGEVTNLKQESLYDHYTKIIKSVIRRMVGSGKTQITIQDVADDALIKEVELTYDKVNVIVGAAVKRGWIIRSKVGASWNLSLPLT